MLVQRVLWRTSSLRASAIPASFCKPNVLRRGLAFLEPNNEFLKLILAQDGFLDFFQPPGTKLKEDIKRRSKGIIRVSDIATSDPHLFRMRYFTIRFSIDRNEICIKCDISMADSNQKLASDALTFHGKYPPFKDKIKAPGIAEFTIEEGSDRARIKDFADVMWMSFCKRDFLTFTVEGVLYPTGSISFSQPSAQVDESAAHRQTAIFEKVTRNESSDELEAEKSFLVYRRFVHSIQCSFKVS
jgi:hypothetical protein